MRRRRDHRRRRSAPRRWATWRARRAAEFRGVVVGVTGSNGKTTTKELCAAALRPLGAVLRTAGQLQHRRRPAADDPVARPANEAAWVLEMAMRGRGEIAYLAELARPARRRHHQRRRGAPRDASARSRRSRAPRASCSRAWRPTASAVLPAERPADRPRRPRTSRPERRLTLRRARGAGDVRMLDVSPAGAARLGRPLRGAAHEPVVVRLPLAGAHNARNGAAALAVALRAGVAPLGGGGGAGDGRAAAAPVGGAGGWAGGTSSTTATTPTRPRCSAALATVIAAVGGAGGGRARSRCWATCWSSAPTPRRCTARSGREAGVAAGGRWSRWATSPRAVADGARAAGLAADRGRSRRSPEAAAAVIASWTAPGDWILVKASRGMRLERVVEALADALATATT